MKDTTDVVWVMLVAVIVVAVMPFLIIWSLNTLFPVLAIAYTPQTWAAVLIMCWTLRPAVQINKS